MASRCFAGKLVFPRKFHDAAIALTTLVVLIVLTLVTIPRARAQSQSAPVQSTAAPRPSFEVASIKRHPPGDNTSRFGGPDISRFSATNVTVKFLIEFAYHVEDFQISGGPSWIAYDKFDVDAKVEDSIAGQMQKLPVTQQSDQLKLMVQSLLADRFKLSVSHATKELPIFALVVAKGGPKLTEAAAPDATDNSARGTSPASAENHGTDTRPGRVVFSARDGQVNVTAKATPMTDMATLLSRQLRRPVLDQTGLKATYDWALQWAAGTGLGGGPLPAVPGSADAPDFSGPSIFTALQEQLGLRLESTKGPVDTIVIDHIEEPSEN
jgi:uncharacterized protein (TIGR03435 family)